MLVLLLKREGYEATAVASGEQALAELDARPYDVVLSDIRMPKLGGLELVDEIKQRNLPTTVIVMSAFGNLDLALEAMKRGAYDYVSKPFSADEVVLVLKKAEERERLRRENAALKQRAGARRARTTSAGSSSMIARAPKMQEIFRTIRKIAEYKTTVLITGESGTGKELVARAIHEQSPRATGRSSRSTAARSPRRCSRASCSGTRRARSPTPSATRRGSSRRPRAARCSSTRSASCRWAAGEAPARACRSTWCGRSARSRI